METRRIGKSGLEVSVLGLGCNNFGARLDQALTDAVVHRALDRGITFFDTADSYGGEGRSEVMLGRALGAHRDKAIVATKFGWSLLDGSGARQGASPRYVRQAVEASLRRLSTDRIDMYQMHQHDPQTPIEDTLGVLADLVSEGKIRHAGCSNLTPAQVERARRAADNLGSPSFVSSQNHYNLLSREIEAELVPTLRRLDMSLIPYSPLASGLLSGKFRRDAPMPEGARLTGTPRLAERYCTDRNWQIVEALTAFGAARGRSLLDVAISWIASRQPVCSVIAGAMTPGQVDGNAAAAAWRMSDAELAEIDAISAPAGDVTAPDRTLSGAPL